MMSHCEPVINIFFIGSWMFFCLALPSGYQPASSFEHFNLDISDN